MLHIRKLTTLFLHEAIRLYFACQIKTTAGMPHIRIRREIRQKFVFLPEGQSGCSSRSCCGDRKEAR